MIPGDAAPGLHEGASLRRRPEWRRERRLEMAVEKLKAHDVFRYLAPEQVRVISNSAELITRTAGDTVYYMGTPATHLYVLLHGQIALRLPGREGISLLIDQLGEGSLFGSCICIDMSTYYLTAQCVSDVEMLRIEAKLLRRLMEEDLTMGFALQQHITKVYFTRYVETMKKLQSIILSLPLEGA
jgi:CRP-like cAMP-binding protein